MPEKLKIYDENGQYTDDGRELVGVLGDKIGAIIEEHADKYNRIEFEHLMTHEVTCRFALWFIKNHDWPEQEDNSGE